MAIWASRRQKRPWWGRICSSPHAQNSLPMSLTRTVRSSPGLAVQVATCSEQNNLILPGIGGHCYSHSCFLFTVLASQRS